MGIGSLQLAECHAQSDARFVDPLHVLGSAGWSVAHGTHALGGLPDATAGPGIPGGCQEGEGAVEASLSPVRCVLRRFQESVEVRPRPVGVGLEVQQCRGRAVTAS